MDTKTIIALLTEIRDLLTEIRDHQRANLASQTVLDERREKDRLRQRKCRAAKCHVTTDKCHVTEKNEEAREEKSPHTPLKGEREEARKDSLSRACAREADFDVLFASFWASYPACGSRKRDKQKCRARFLRILSDADDPQSLFDALMRGLSAWKKSRDWIEGFICTPLVWLNNSRWETEIAAEPVKPAAVDPKVAAFERQRAENEARKKRSEALAAQYLREINEAISHAH